MDHLNKQIRKRALRRFILIFSLMSVFLLCTSAILFYTPSRVMQGQVRQLKQTIDEQEHLITVMDTLGNELKKIQGIDERQAGEKNIIALGNLGTELQGRESLVKTLLYTTAADTSKLRDVVNKRLARSILNSAGATMGYRNTIAMLKESIKGSGEGAKSIEDLKRQLQASRDKLDMLQMLQAGKSPSGGGGGGGNNQEVEDLKAQLRAVNTGATVPAYRVAEVEANAMDLVASGDMYICDLRVNYYTKAKQKLMDMAFKTKSADTRIKISEKINELNKRIKERRGCN